MILSQPGRFSIAATDGLLMIIWAITAIIAVNLAARFFDKFAGKRIVSGDNTTTGIFFGAISVLYSLIIAFVIMAEWDDFNGLNDTITQETDKLNGIIAHSSSLPDSMKTTIYDEIEGYCKKVVTREWQMLKKDSTQRPSAIPALRHMLLITEPGNTVQERTLAVIDEDLSAVSDLRRERLSHTRSQLPPLVWTIMNIGAVLLILFCFFFTASSVIQRSIYLSFLVGLLAMCFSLIYSLDHPFRPGSGLDSSPYKGILEELSAIKS